MAFPNIYVGGLAWKTTSDDLRRYFQPFGEVVDAYIISDSSTGKSKGFGFVRFKDDESAAKALENRKPMIDGRVVRDFISVSSMGFAKIFVGDLSLKTTANDACVVFESHPPGRSKGYGFSYNQERTNMIHPNNETDQGNTVVVDNADKITDQGKVEVNVADEEDSNIREDTTKEIDKDVGL